MERWRTITLDVSEHEGPVIEAACRMILATLRDPAVLAKHPPWNWTTESCDIHLLAGAGHAILAVRQGFGFKAKDGEDHVARALTRCAEAAAVRAICDHEPGQRTKGASSLTAEAV